MSTETAYCEFTSASTAGIVYLEIGFIPDEVTLLSNYGAAALTYKWFNPNTVPNIVATNTIVMPGGSVANSLDTATLIQPYAGGETIAAAETVNSSPKHVTRSGVAAPAGRQTSVGIQIAAAAQTNSGKNVVIATRGDGGK